MSFKVISNLFKTRHFIPLSDTSSLNLNILKCI